MDRRYAYHTPQQNSGATIIRMIVAPVDFIPMIGGALGDLTDENSWDEIGITIDETVGEMIKMLDFFYDNPLVGLIAPFAYVPLPEGWIAMVGQSITNADTDYPELWAKVPPLWKSGTTLNLPAMNDRTIIGYTAGTPPNIGAVGGETTHTLTVNELPAHTHTYGEAAPNIDVEAPGVPDFTALGLPFTPQDTGSTGNGQAHNNMPPYLSAIWAIFAGRA